MKQIETVHGHLYEQVAAHVVEMVERGTYRCGERVPSVRKMSRQLELSVTTVLEGYRLLEDQGVLEARPQSGFFVARPPAGPPSTPIEACEKPVPVEVGNLISKFLRDLQVPELVQLSAACPSAELLPTRKLTRSLIRAARKSENDTFYDVPPGNRELRVQIAQRAVAAGCMLSPDDVVLTLGCQEALTLCLRAACRPGDIVAVETPTYHGQLQAIEMLGLRVLEVPGHPVDGISLPALRLAVEQMPIRAVLATPSYSNPTGSSIPDAQREELVKMLAEREIPLIEDDVYGDLGFAGKRTRAAKAYDEQGLVLYCSSFSKTLAPSYRVGWAVPGRFKEDVIRFKALSNLASPTLPAYAISDYLSRGGYDQYLRKVRRSYAQHVREMSQAVLHHFPKGTTVSTPAGGFVLWVNLPAGRRALDLYERALEAGIGIAPGPIFSASKRFEDAMRLTASNWTPRIEEAVETLGKLVHAG